jgi:hypothetical protein
MKNIIISLAEEVFLRIGNDKEFFVLVFESIEGRDVLFKVRGIYADVLAALQSPLTLDELIQKLAPSQPCDTNELSFMLNSLAQNGIVRLSSPISLSPNYKVTRSELIPRIESSGEEGEGLFVEIVSVATEGEEELGAVYACSTSCSTT